MLSNPLLPVVGRQKTLRADDFRTIDLRSKSSRNVRDIQFLRACALLARGEHRSVPNQQRSVHGCVGPAGRRSLVVCTGVTAPNGWRGAHHPESIVIRSATTRLAGSSRSTTMWCCSNSFSVPGRITFTARTTSYCGRRLRSNPDFVRAGRHACDLLRTSMVAVCSCRRSASQSRHPTMSIDLQFPTLTLTGEALYTLAVTQCGLHEVNFRITLSFGLWRTVSTDAGLRSPALHDPRSRM